MSNRLENCDWCGQPADYSDTTARGLMACERCARRTSDQERGEAFAALTILQTVAGSLRRAGMEDAGIHRALDFALAADGTMWDQPAPMLPAWASGDFEDDTRYVPLNAAAGKASDERFNSIAPPGGAGAKDRATSGSTVADEADL
jgi:hypothetical protein